MKTTQFALASVEVLVATTLGFLAIVVPVALDPNVKQYDANFLPIVATAVEGMKPMSVALLFLAGAVVGLFGRQPFWLSGAATMLAFPVWSWIDIVLGMLADWNPEGDPAVGSHNLFPIEWAIYGMLSLFGVAGAWCARWLRTRRILRRTPSVRA